MRGRPRKVPWPWGSKPPEKRIEELLLTIKGQEDLARAIMERAEQAKAKIERNIEYLREEIERTKDVAAVQKSAEAKGHRNEMPHAEEAIKQTDSDEEVFAETISVVGIEDLFSEEDQNEDD